MRFCVNQTWMTCQISLDEHDQNMEIKEQRINKYHEHLLIVDQVMLVYMEQVLMNNNHMDVVEDEHVNTI